MWRRAVREVVRVEVGEEERFGGAGLGVGALIGWSVVMVLEAGSTHLIVAPSLSSSMLSAKEVGVASALICRGISALWGLLSVVPTSLSFL